MTSAAIATGSVHVIAPVEQPDGTWAAMTPDGRQMSLYGSKRWSSADEAQAAIMAHYAAQLAFASIR